MERRHAIFTNDEFEMAERFAVELAETRAMMPVQFRREIGVLEGARVSLDFQIRDVLNNAPRPLGFADALERRRKVEELEKTSVMVEFKIAFLSFDTDLASYRRFLNSVRDKVDDRLYGLFVDVGLENGMLGEGIG